MARDVLVTGIGLVSSLGEGVETHVAALRDGTSPKVDAESFRPYPVHPMAALELDRQIPKKSDQRQMETWQRLGVYAAGLALDSAGLKDQPEARARLECIVAAGGGERDHAVDGQVLTGIRAAADKGAYLNERLMSDLRPTLFLAQLSNLLAGNISIVHGVTGASRTFMGEEQCGVDAIRTAHARIAHGQCEAMLVGGAYNAERRDMLLLFELGNLLWKAPFKPVFERAASGGGLIVGSMAAFLLLEAREVAEARGARAFARLSGVAADQCRRKSAGEVTTSIAQLVRSVGPAGLVISTATGAEPATSAEAAALAEAAPGARVVASGDLIGHGVEATFPAAVAIAAAAVAAGVAPDALVAGAGHWRGEGAARLCRA